jgi:hypothetical protein
VERLDTEPAGCDGSEAGQEASSLGLWLALRPALPASEVEPCSPTIANNVSTAFPDVSGRIVVLSVNTPEPRARLVHVWGRRCGLTVGVKKGGESVLI